MQCIKKRGCEESPQTPGGSQQLWISLKVSEAMIGALLKRAPQRFFLEKRFNEINLKSFGQSNLDKGRVVKQTETAAARRQRGGAQRHGGKPRDFGRLQTSAPSATFVKYKSKRVTRCVFCITPRVA